MPKIAAEFDLNQIRVHEALFLDCCIVNAAQPPIGPGQVAGFTDPDVVLLPFFSLEQQLVSFEVRVHTRAFGREGEELALTGYFRLHLAFQVTSLPDQLRPSPVMQVSVPSPELSALLVGAAYSTMRGMIMSKVSDTVLGGFALPLRSVGRLMGDSNKVLQAQQEAVTASPPKRPRKRKPPTEAASGA